MRTKPVLALVAMIGVGAGLSGAGTAEAQQNLPDPERGRAIASGAFAGGVGGACQACHGIDGAGDAVAGFPRLAGQPREYLVKSLADYAAGRRKSEVMQPIAEALTEAEMWDVSAYYARTNGVGLPAEVDATPEMLERGGTIAAIGADELGLQGCQNCHGPLGQGEGFQYPALAGQSAVYLRDQLNAWREGRREGDTFDIMRNIAARLAPADVEAVAAYYATLPPRDLIDAATIRPAEEDTSR